MPFVRVEPEEPKGRFRRVEPEPAIEEAPILTGEEAEDFRYRTLNVPKFRQIYQMPVDADTEEDLRRFSYGKDATPKTAWEKMKRAWEIGTLARDLGRLRAQQMEGDISPELLERVEALKGKMPTQEQVFGSLPEKAVAKMIEMLPIMTGGIPKGVKVGVPTGLAAAGAVALVGQIPPFTMLPEEIITAPSAFSLMFVAGLSTAMIEDIMRIEAGLAYDELLDLRDEEGNPINPEIARWTAASVGAINALIEMAQIKLAFKTIPGADKILRSTATKVIRKAVADGTLKQIALRSAGRYGAFVTKETGQEIVQEGTVLLGNRIAGELHTALTDKGVETETATQAIDRLIATAEQAALGFAVMPIPGMAVGVTREVVTRKRPGMPDEVISEKEITEEEAEVEFEKEEVELAKKEGIVEEKPFPESEWDRQVRIQRLKPEPGMSVKGQYLNVEFQGTIEKYRFNEANADIMEVSVDLTKPITVLETEREKILVSVNLSTKRPTETSLAFNDLKGKNRIELLPKEIEAKIEPEPRPTVRIEERPPLIKSAWQMSKQEFIETAQTIGRRKEFGSAYDHRRMVEKAVKDGKPVSIENLEEYKDQDWAKEALAAYKEAEIEEEKPEVLPTLSQEAWKTEIEKILTVPQEIQDLDKTIKKAERAIKKALRAKEMETAKAEKAKYKAAEQRKKERQQLREMAEKLASVIARPAGPSIHIDYREAIEHLQAGIDPSFRSSKTLERRKRIRKYLARHPEAIEQMPTRLLRQINMKAIERYTLKELADIATEITKLRQFGRMKRALEVARFKREVEATALTLAENIAQGKPIAKPAEPILGKEKTTIAKALGWTRAMSLRPSRIADIFDLGKQFKGLFHRTFIDDVNAAENAKLNAIDSRRDEGKKRLDELGITLNDLGKTREIEGNDFTLDKMIDIYVGWKNPLKRTALMFGNNIDEELAQKVIAELTIEEKTLGDWVVDEYQNNYERLRQAFIEHTGEDLGSEENYTPIRRVELTYDPLAQQIAEQLLARHNLKRGFPERGFTKARIKELPPEFQKPIWLGAYSTWIGQVNEQEHYIHYAVLVKKLHRILANNLLTEAIKQKFGSDYHTAMKNYVNRAANPTIYKSYEGIDKASRAMRKNVALTYLGLNLVTMGKQLPSMALYLGECGPGHLLSSAADFAAHPFEMMEFVTSRDPQVKHRKIERELEELKLADAGLYSRMQKAIGRVGMMGIYAMDRAAITIGWKAVYDANVNRVGEIEAIRLAQNATLRTQPEAHAKDIADLYAKGEAYNWFLMFTNQLNQIYNLTTHDIPSNVRQGRYYDALLQTTGFAISALVIWIITNKTLPEKPDDVLEAIAEQFINSLPLIGRYIVSGAEGWAAGAPAPIEALANLSRAFAKDTTSETKAKALLEAISMFVGYPYVGTKRIVEAVVEGEPGRLLGGPKKKKTKWAKE